MIFDVGYLILITALGAGCLWHRRRLLGRQTAQHQAGGEQLQCRLCRGRAGAGRGGLILWYGLLDDHFELTYVWNHSERALPTFYKFSALVGRAGRQPALLVSDPLRLQRDRGRFQSQAHSGDHALCQRRAAGHLALLPDAACLCRQSLRARRLCAARWPGAEPAAAELLDGDPPGHALSGLCGHGRAVCLCRRRPDEQAGSTTSGCAPCAAGR